MEIMTKWWKCRAKSKYLKQKKTTAYNTKPKVTSETISESTALKHRRHTRKCMICRGFLLKHEYYSHLHMVGLEPWLIPQDCLVHSCSR